MGNELPNVGQIWYSGVYFLFIVSKSNRRPLPELAGFHTTKDKTNDRVISFNFKSRIHIYHIYTDIYVYISVTHFKSMLL